MLCQTPACSGTLPTEPVTGCWCQAVSMLHAEVGSQAEGACGDMLVLPIYAALPPELQVCPPTRSSPPITSQLLDPRHH